MSEGLDWKNGLRDSPGGTSMRNGYCSSWEGFLRWSTCAPIYHESIYQSAHYATCHCFIPNTWKPRISLLRDIYAESQLLRQDKSPLNLLTQDHFLKVRQTRLFEQEVRCGY